MHMHMHMHSLSVCEAHKLNKTRCWAHNTVFVWQQSPSHSQFLSVWGRGWRRLHLLLWCPALKKKKKRTDSLQKPKAMG